MCQLFAFKKLCRLALESNRATSFRHTIIKGDKKGIGGGQWFFFLFLLHFDFLNAPDERAWALAFFSISIDCPRCNVHNLGVFAKVPTCIKNLNCMIRFSSTGTDNCFYSKCGGCNEDIRDKYLLQALDKLWHVYCLRCCDCRETLDEGKCFFREGNILCKIDFFRWAIIYFEY